MFENILHAPLQLHSGASKAAHSLLEGLLERDVPKRLGGSRDLVSVKRATMHNTLTRGARSNFSVFPGGAAGTFLLRIYQLDWPPCQESSPPVHPKCGKCYPEERGQHFFFKKNPLYVFTPDSFSERSLWCQLHWPGVYTTTNSSLPEREVPALRNHWHLPRILLHEPSGVCGFVTAPNPLGTCFLKYFSP